MLLVDDDETFRERLGRPARPRLRGSYRRLRRRGRLSPRTTPPSTPSSTRMPGKGGMEMLRELKRVDAGTRSVVLTGYGSIATAVEAVRLGAVNFIPKPADADDVVAAFEKYERGDPAEGPVVTSATGRPRSPAWSGSTSSGSSPTAAGTSPSPPVASGSTAARCSASSSATPRRSAAELRSDLTRSLGSDLAGHESITAGRGVTTTPRPASHGTALQWPLGGATRCAPWDAQARSADGRSSTVARAGGARDHPAILRNCGACTRSFTALGSLSSSALNSVLPKESLRPPGGIPRDAYRARARALSARTTRPARRPQPLALRSPDPRPLPRSPGNPSDAHSRHAPAHREHTVSPAKSDGLGHAPMSSFHFPAGRTTSGS